MELTITSTVYINLDEIIDSINNGMEIEEAVSDYVAGLDDCEYYLVGYDEQEKIIAEIKKILDNVTEK